MSVAASVYCHDCRQFAPNIGDGGALGLPSIVDTPTTMADLHTFGYLQKGFDAIGYKPWSLEAIAAFLRAHQGHDVALYHEGEEVKPYGEEGRTLGDVTGTTTFTFDDIAFVDGLFEAACKKCNESVRSGPVRLRAAKPLTLSAKAIKEFMTRVRGADETNLHRLPGLLDFYGDQERWAAFLTAHAAHRPAVRIVQEESWHADRARKELPWQLAWQKSDFFPIDREPLVAGGRVFALSGPSRYPKSAAPHALYCFSLDGVPIWRRELSTWSGRRVAMTPNGLVVRLALGGTPATYEIVGLDPDSGETLWSGRTQYDHVDWLPGERSYIGLQYGVEARKVAVIQLPGLEPQWEWTDPSPNLLEGVDYRRAFWTDDGILLAGHGARNTAGWARCLDLASGRERWFTSLQAFGIRSTSDFLRWRDFFLLKGLDQVIALDVRDGRVAWTGESPLWYWRESHDLLLGYASGVGAFDLQQRRMRFLAGFGQFGAAPEPLPQPSPVSAGLVATDSEILMVDVAHRRLWGLDIDTGLPLWMHAPVNGVMGQHPVLAGDRLIIQGPGLCCYVRGST